MNHVPVDRLTFEWFSARLKTKFRVDLGPSHRLELELVEVNAARSRSGSLVSGELARVEGFSLVFTGPSAPLLPQGTYRFEHGPEGFDLFMVPVGRGPDTIQYEVVFNRIIPAG